MVYDLAHLLNLMLIWFHSQLFNFSETSTVRITCSKIHSWGKS